VKRFVPRFVFCCRCTQCY